MDEPQPQPPDINVSILETLQAMQKQLKDLADKNETLVTENAVLRSRGDPEAGLPGHLSIGTTGLGNRAARSVTVATRPVVDNPTDPLWGPKVADPKDLGNRR